MRNIFSLPRRVPFRRILLYLYILQIDRNVSQEKKQSQAAPVNTHGSLYLFLNIAIS